MMRTVWVLASALFIAAGCSHAPPSPIGYWKYKTVILQPVGDPSHKTKTKKELGEQLGNEAATRLEKDMYANLSLEFRSDGTYTLDAIIPVDGTWIQEGTEITMDPDKMLHLNSDQISQAGMEGGFNQKESTAIIGQNGKKLTYMANNGMAEVVLVPGEKPPAPPPPVKKTPEELESDPF